ncbi:SNARE-associated protein Snapin [Genypterus blacodes]|uniref:SNARE-associated protein Snapin n=1 Tax=Genypterus blacodes TaxID=154954 RepID=UPI003F75D9E2
MVPARCLSLAGRKWIDACDVNSVTSAWLCYCKMASSALIESSSPGKDVVAEGLLDLLKPAIQQLDLHVHSVRESQVELREHIDNLATELCRINEHQKVALDLDPYVKKLLNARRRVVLVNNILQNAQERLRRLNHNVAKETARRKTMLEASGVFTSRSPCKP